MTPQRIVAIEEHVATDAFLTTTHALAPLPGDETEVRLTHTVESGAQFHGALTEIDSRLAGMDAAGQTMAILSINPPGVQPYPVEAAVPLARHVNDELAALVRSNPTRFGAFATLAPQDPQASAEEIERVMGPLGLNGVMINSHTQGHYLDEPQFEPLLAAAETNHAPIYLHPRFPSMLAPYDAYGLQAAIFGYQAEAGLHAMRLITSGTLDRHPRLTIILGHLGEGLPYWLKRIDNRHAFASRVTGAAGSMPKLELTPSEYFRRNFYITTSGMDDPAVLDLAISAAGEDHVMFAIDTPYEDTTEAVRFLQETPITDVQREKISHRNADRVFKLG